MNGPAPRSTELVVDARTAIGEERNNLGLGRDDQANALCLSGGGIRSAAFGLGVIQALAEAGLLRRFHYLSTVSGGGYIGGWLTRLIATANEDPTRKGKPVDLADIEAKLAKRKDGFEDPELRALRRYTNYLAPRLGPLSADLWAGILLWIRNTLINWLVFTPLFVAAAAVPLLYATLIAVLTAFPPHGSLPMTLPEALATGLAVALATAGPVMLGIMTYRSIVELPSHSFPASMDPLPPTEKFGQPGRVLNRSIARWAVVWCFLAPVAAVPVLAIDPTTVEKDIATLFRPAPAVGAHRVEGGRGASAAAPDACRVVVTVTPPPPCAVAPDAKQPRPSIRQEPWQLWLIVATVLAVFASGMIAFRRARKAVENFDYGGRADYKEIQLKLFSANARAWTCACALSAVVDGLGLYLGAGLGPIAIALAGPPWVLMAEILRSTVYIALRSDALRGDLDREWTARLNGVKLSLVVVFSLGALLVLVAPGYVAANAASWLAIAGGGAASGTLAALLGKSAKTVLAARKADGSAMIGRAILINVAIVIFGSALILIAGRGAALLSQALAGLVERAVEATAATGPLKQPWPDLILFGLLAAVAFVAWRLPAFFAMRINLNNFSMHAVYRNRLVRAFLGTARPPDQWRPDRYTHFDPRDDMRIARAFENRSPRALFPVVNVALNSTSGKDKARAERKALPFTITPYRCGFAEPSETAKGAGHYADTEHYAGDEQESGPGDLKAGISLGTAIALSGAAASPNMGYHSSPLTAFVMTLFNVRLGAWLPNPARADGSEAFLRATDADGIGPILNEIAGRSDEGDQYVYLSDGGHFDNLALYEMLRRRCRYLVVVDAGQDGSYAYADLRMLIQHASTDFGIKVAFTGVQPVGAKELKASGALATVTYPEVEDGPLGRRGEEQGTILYIKPWLSPEGPLELRAFQTLRKDFPHEPTGNQFFTESDFESYRDLGRYIVATALKGYRSDVPGRTPALGPDDIEMARLFASLAR